MQNSVSFNINEIWNLLDIIHSSLQVLLREC